MTKTEIVRALLAKTVANGCTPQEAASAKAKAEEMMVAHGITMEQATSVPFSLDEFLRRAAQQPDAYASTAILREGLRRAAETARHREQMAWPNPGTIAYAAWRLLKAPECLSYTRVLLEINRQFPYAETSTASLRYYETKMRKAGVSVPKGRKRT